VGIGTSGWNYPSGRGTWNGVFYPSPRPRGFDELAYYAEHFDTVEVNSTFYRMPEADLTRAWIARTPSSFTFSMKLFQKLTHPDMYGERAGTTAWDVSPADLDLFRRGLDPCASAGRLAAVLLQFPPSFHAEPDTGAYLDWLLEALRDYPLAVELRHRSWSDDLAPTRERLAARQAAWVLIDEPKFADSIRQGPPTAAVEADSHGASLVYLRLHGRNAQRWWQHAESADRYDYLYTSEELVPFAEAARRASRAGRRVLMYLNNHFSAKAVANAAILSRQLDMPVRGPYPREMVARFPELSGIVQTTGLPI
jgi:uncharacterized protein YecE (DUF72 family)